MNNKISNPLLKQLIAEIANKANEGRITDISWNAINEAKKKQTLKKEADEKNPADKKGKPDADKGGDLPSLDEPTADKVGKEKKGGDLPPIPGKQAELPKKDAAAMDSAEKPADSEETSQEDADKAKQDAAKAKAELEKAKAEKAAAEKEIEQNKYVKLSSGAGTKFLLGKVVEHAFKAGEIDALAGEMVEKLKIKSQEDMSAFAEDVVTYMSIPGMPELIASMKTMATKKPEQDEEQPV